MQLESVLRSIQSLSDVSALVRALGHEPLYESIPNEAWSSPFQRPLVVTAIGRSEELPWLGIMSRQPVRDALLLARRISRRGKSGIVLALSSQARRLVITVAFHGCPRLELDLDHPDQESLAALAKLAGKTGGSPLAFAARAADALSTEPVGRRFFREFQATLDRMAAGLTWLRQAEDRHGLALLQLTRVLFLYFIQTKGWLAGRERFLAEEVDRCLTRGRKIQRDLLRPLFFGTLNRPPAERSRLARQFGAIPFLNGGLFEPHLLERRYRSDIPNSLWCSAFDLLFERFHFTVAETNARGSVAPDMLGRVFEGVMAPEARRSSGTFYTPAALVERLLDAALITLLARRLKCSEATAQFRLAEPDDTVRSIVAGITILDPAVGSGAFLLRALERLSSIGTSGSGTPGRRRRVLQRNLFGVDRNATAVRLTELRLWLAVIAYEPAGHPENVRPLPNLDCLIRQGDSLFDPIGTELATPVLSPPPGLAAELSTLRREVVAAAGIEKRKLERRLHAAEAELFGRSLEFAEAQHQAAVRECLEAARSDDLFGQRRGMDRELRGQLSRLRSGIRKLRRARRQLAQEGELPWFHYQSHFADVFARGGFDLVVGNPPWLRSEAIPPEKRRQLAGRYRWWRDKGGPYGKAPDLSVAFLERALELTRSHGVVAMLIPAKIATASYAAVVRHELASTVTLHVLANLTERAEATFEATVYPLALIASNSAPAPAHRVRTSLERSGSRLRQSELRGGGPWILASSSALQVVKALAEEHPSLGEVFTCHLGVKTGINHLFLNPPDNLEPEVLRWALRGRDLRSFRWQSKIRLLWTHQPGGDPLDLLPPKTAAYLESHQAELQRRKDYDGGPWWKVFRARPAVSRFRVVWADLARRVAAAALTGPEDLEYVPLNSCYVAVAASPIQAEALAAWLNSSWIRAIARLGAVPAANGFARFNARTIERLPLPAAALEDDVLAALARRGRSGAAVQDELDRLAAVHLGLSASAQRTLRESVDRGAGHCS